MESLHMEQLIQEIIAIHPHFCKTELAKGLSYFEHRSFKAKDILLKEGEVCNDLFFAQNSVCRCFFSDKDGEEKTVWMEPEKMFITDFESFIKKCPSTYSLQFYKETEVWCISRENLLLLYDSYKDWALFGIKLMESYHVRILELFTLMFRNSATDNYQFIEQYFSAFIQVAPLKDIASMLNLSPVSLSRIRAGKQTRD